MKNIILVVLLFLLNSCGYTSVYKDLGKQDFQITVTDMVGDRDMNNLIKNQLAVYSNKNSTDKYKVAINTSYKKKVFAKNQAGVTTDYQISVNSIFKILTDNDEREFIFDEKINVKSQTDTFAQNLYEKNIKNNFASTLKEKLIAEILALK